MVLVLLAADALACATCQDPDPRRSSVYLDMTVFMSLTPLIAMTAGGVWIWQRVRAVR